MAEYEDAPTYRFERRRADRWPVRGVAIAHLTSGQRFGERCTLRLHDESADGLGATCDHAVPPGTPVTLGFTDPGQPILNGVVVRCLPCGDGYRMAVRFEMRLAA
jgi:hypothetical protein